MKETSKQLFREAIFIFDPSCESGATALVETAPFGFSKQFELPLNRIAQILDKKPPKTDKEIDDLSNIYKDFLNDFEEIVDNILLPLVDYEVPVLHTDNDDGTYSTVITDSNSNATKEAFKLFKIPISEERIDFEKLGLKEEEVDLKYNELRQKHLFESFSNKMATLPKKKFTLTQWHLDMIKTLRWELWINGYCRLSWGLSHNDTENNFDDKMFSNQGFDFLSLMRELHKYEAEKFPIISNNPKRPFGDNTYWYNELPDLGFEGIPVNENDEVPDEIIEKLETTYAEVYKALQCMAWYGEFK